MKLLVQPDDGIESLVKGINNAKRSIEIVVFRFDLTEIERALANAVTRGLSVRALIAHTNRAGEENLRKLEMRLLAAGVTVARTADDLVRYHGKLMIVDGHELYLLAFNWTYLDMERSRSFGIVTRSAAIVREGQRLFEADSERRPYEPGTDTLVVSPVNARRVLGEYIGGAQKSLVIYDPKVSDPGMLDLLEERAKAGVEIRIIGHLTKHIPGVEVCKLASLRLHTRTMVRDGQTAFVGSQSLRAIELDGRREVGLIFRDRRIVSRLLETFEGDWKRAQEAAQTRDQEAPSAKVAKRVAKLVTRELPDVVPVVNGAVKEIAGEAVDVELSPEEIEEVVKTAVKEAVKEAVSDLVQEVVEKVDGTGR